MGLNDMNSIYTVKVYRENYKESSRKAFFISTGVCKLLYNVHYYI